MEEAMDRPGHERDDHLDRACIGDPSLRREVASLLRALDEAGSFIDKAPVHVSFADDDTAGSPALPALPAGASLGRFVILGMVGQGGMGVVYAAYDPDLDRKVALKLLRDVSGDPQGGVQARLMREAQALARLSHPNVITIYDVGSVDGRVFIAMEFVAGDTLREWLDRQPRSWREVREVFLGAGRGLAAAHAAGLVHRDFKPGNVLVGPDGRVLVLDFGLARAHEAGAAIEAGAAAEPDGHGARRLERPLTLAGTLIGTPAYMAPEQRAGGRADAAADQFSFCVALHEALYGQRPFAAKDGWKDPPDWTLVEPPGGSNVPAWLRRVVVKGLSVDPAGRHATIDALLVALARDPGRRRRRWLAAGAGGAVVAVSVLAPRFLFQPKTLCGGGEAKMAGVWNESRRAEVRKAFLASGASFAGDAWPRVSAALDAHAARWVSMHTDACEATQVRGEQSADLLDRRMACLDQGLREMGALTERLASADTALVQGAVSAVKGLTPLAHCADTEALTAPVRPPADDAAQQKVRALRERLADAKAAEAAGAYGAGLEIATKVASDAERLGYWPLTAEALLRLGALQAAQAQPESAAASLNAAILAAEAGRHERVAAEAFAHLVRVEGILRTNREAALRHAAYASAMLSQLGQRDQLEATLASHLGHVWFHEAKYDLALEQHRRALALRRSALGPADPEVAATLTLMGHVYAVQGKLREALDHFEQALHVYEKALGPSHPKFATSLDEVGAIYYRLADYPAARQRHQRALEVLEAALGPDHRLIATVLTNLGNVELAQGDPRAALAAHRRALTILERTLGPRHPKVSIVLNSVGLALVDAGEERQAVEVYRKALALQESAYGPRHPWVASTLFNLAEAQKNMGQHAIALKHYRRALSIWDEVLEKDHYLRAYGLTGLGEALLGLRRPADARAALEQALEMAGRIPLEPRLLGVTQFALARALLDSGGPVEKPFALAEQSIVTLRGAGAGSKRDLAAAESWLRDQRAKRPAVGGG
jgi:tetratricopeptide (TPR) repeat protein